MTMMMMTIKMMIFIHLNIRNGPNSKIQPLLSYSEVADHSVLRLPSWRDPESCS